MLSVFELTLQVVDMKEISSLLYRTLENLKFRNNSKYKKKSIIEILKVFKKLRNLKHLNWEISKLLLICFMAQAKAIKEA